MNHPRMSDARATLTRLATLFDFTVTDNVLTPQNGRVELVDGELTVVTPWWDMPKVPRTQFTLTRDNKVVCDIRVGWTDDDHVAEIHVRDGSGSGRVGGEGDDLDKLLSDQFAMAEGMATYFRNNPHFDGGA